MGFFGRLFGTRPGPAEASFNRRVALVSDPTDPKLLKDAQNRKGHLGFKAVSDEYNRLILQKHKS
jgi:hypothetical protein